MLSFRAKSRNPVAVFKVTPRDPSTSLRMTRVASAIQNHILGRRIKHRATTDRFAKCFAKVTQAGVSDFSGGLSDIVASRAQQLGCAFHSQVAQILRNGETHFARKNPA